MIKCSQCVCCRQFDYLTSKKIIFQLRLFLHETSDMLVSFSNSSDWNVRDRLVSRSLYLREMHMEFWLDEDMYVSVNQVIDQCYTTSIASVIRLALTLLLCLFACLFLFLSFYLSFLFYWPVFVLQGFISPTLRRPFRYRERTTRRDVSMFRYVFKNANSSRDHDNYGSIRIVWSCTTSTDSFSSRIH